MKGFVDIGSHYAEEYFDLKPQIRDHINWIFFEPVKSTYDEMCRRLPQASNIKTHNIALGNMIDEIEMFTESHNKGQSSSILKPKIHLEQYPMIVFNGRTKVKIDKLDNIEYDRNLYDVMHIDVQGYELEVLKGAINSLANINILTCEVNKEELYEGCPMIGDITDFLYKCGLRLFSINWIGGNWGDATYKRL